MSISELGNITISCTDFNNKTNGLFDNPLKVEFEIPEIKKVIYNDPATIILWEDGSKTVVTCSFGDVYDKQRGFLLCCAKKLFGNTGKFNEVMNEWCPYESFENELLNTLIDATRGF